MSSKILKLFWFMGGSVIFGIVTVVSVVMYFSFGLPKISTLADYNPPTPSKILSKDGVVLAVIGKEKRDVVSFENIPRRIVDAFLSAEDSSFYDHHGVDYFGVFRAMLVNLKAGKVVQGGSTITQQVAKSLLLTRERSISRKIKDFLLAQKIEEKFSKEEILFLYLNQVYLGGGYYGVKEAFKGYFDKELEDATIAESAIIAGLLVAPGKYSPYINPEFAFKRQRYVLGRMKATGKISNEEYDAALKERIKFRIRKPNNFKAGYFTDWIRQRVISLVGEDEFLSGGYTVETTLDYELQKVAEKSVLDGVREIDKRQGYKGPIRRIDLADDLKEYEISFRRDLYSNLSNYFIVNDSYKREYEIEFRAEAYDKFFEKRDEKITSRLYNKFYPGYDSEDPLVSLLQTGNDFNAVVMKVDDSARLIYVSVGGVSGIIPYDKFKWAHEREISEDKKFFPYVTKPSTILKPGDVVQVKVLNSKVNIEKYIYKGAISEYKKRKNFKDIKKENYLLCALEQDAEVEGALVSIDPFTGDIISFVGGANFKKSQFNRAIQSLRQPGSSFKPFLFAAALEKGYTPASIILDSPEALGGSEQGLNWKPRNYDNRYKGPMTFRNSLEQSRNIPTIKIADKLGVKNILDFMDRICLDAKLQEDLSLSLGSFGVTLLDIVTAYGIFPNGGNVVDYRSVISIKDKNGNLYKLNENFKEQKINTRTSALVASEVEDTEEKTEIDKSVDPSSLDEINFFSNLVGKQVYDKRLAYVMTNLLRGVVLHGTGRRAREVSNYLGGKTGTTSNYVDAWFLGFSPKIVAGVWTGFDENQTLGWGETGTKSALPIWKKYMSSAIKKFGETDFDVPSGIVNVRINKETGKLSSQSIQDSFLESFVAGTEPRPVEETLIEVEDTDEVNSLELNSFGEDDYYDNQ